MSQSIPINRRRMSRVNNTPQNTPENGNSLKNPSVQPQTVPQETRDLLVKWITGSATQEKLDMGFSKTGGRFANIYSWASGENNLPENASEQARRQFDVIRRSYILHNNERLHKTRVFLSDPSVVKSIEDFFQGKYTVALRKYKNGEGSSLIQYRWIVQLQSKDAVVN